MSTLTATDNQIVPKKSTPPPPRRRPRHVLAVRMLVANVAWLDGAPVWHEGQVVWRVGGDDDFFAPRAADIARTQRRLNQIGRHPVSAVFALGDAVAWLAVRRTRLALAKLRFSIDPSMHAPG